MDTTGADFAFDSDMDFANLFPTKPSEGNTSQGLFFGDEAIDTTASFMDSTTFCIDPQQTAFDMQPTLSMDNTSGSGAGWTGQLTPQSQNTLNSFPPTPMQSFDASFRQSTALGKRPLQLDDVYDFPQAKRPEVASYSSPALFPLGHSSAAAADWTVQTQSTPPGSFGAGLNDEAADMCAMWFSKYAILPGDRHIESLSQLTGEPAEAIRQWFGRLLKQGMGGSFGDSAYRSQTSLTQPSNVWNDFPTDLVQVPQLTPEQNTDELEPALDVSLTHNATTAIQTVTAPQGRKKQRCTPTEDRSLLSRDANKVYQCTRKCGKRYGRKCDWKRNEEEGYPCKSWVCSLCTSEGVENVKACYRKYHFAQHFRNIHPSMNSDHYEETSIISSETDFPRNCGFCKHRFESRQERIDHIGDHFKQGKCMLDWNDNRSDESDDDTNDDDDRPSGDGSNNNRQSHRPPHQDPRGGSDATHFGSGFSDDGSSGGSQGGYFQFQLSQLQKAGLGSPLYWANQRIKPTVESQHILQCSRAASEPLQQQQPDGLSPSRDCTTHGECHATKEDNRDTVAGDALTRTLLTHHSVAKTSSLANTGALAVAASTSHRFATRSETGASHMIEPSCGDQDISLDPGHNRNARTDQPVPLSSSMHDNSVVLSGRKATFSSVRFLGAGGFGMVDEVVHSETGLHLGRKTLKNRGPAAMKELLEEVNVLKKLRHPHIIRFLGAYSRDDKLSILVSPVADTTLALWLDRVTSRKPENITQIATKMMGCLASSVRYLHEQQPVVVHMDIKPQNILVVEGKDAFPHIVLCDFGNSSTHADGQAKPLTRRYAAPEVFEGATRKQPADIWSLGCVFAELASTSYSQDRIDDWASIRTDYNGKTGKCYWEDVPNLQKRLTNLLEQVASPAEGTVAHTLKSMLSSQPADRPNAATLSLIFAPAPCCEGIQPPLSRKLATSAELPCCEDIQLPLPQKLAANAQALNPALPLEQSHEDLQPLPTGAMIPSIAPYTSTAIATCNVMDTTNDPVQGKLTTNTKLSDLSLPLAQVRALLPSRMRDCQWIRKEGDGIGDSMEAAQSTLQVGDARALLLANNDDRRGGEETCERLQSHESREDFQAQPTGLLAIAIAPHMNSSVATCSGNNGTAGTHNDAKTFLDESSRNGNKNGSSGIANGNGSSRNANGNGSDLGIAGMNKDRVDAPAKE